MQTIREQRNGTKRTSGETRKRLTARIPTAMRRTLEEAAGLAGATVNQFIVQIAYEEAQRLLERESVIRLSRQDAARVFDLMEKPPAPTKKLVKAVKEFAKAVRA